MDLVGHLLSIFIPIIFFSCFSGKDKNKLVNNKKNL